MCSISAMKIYIQYGNKPIQNTVAMNILIIVNFVILLLAVVIIGLVSNIYYFVYITYILPKMQNED